jgi:FkbM family methyltransferase
VPRAGTPLFDDGIRLRQFIRNLLSVYSVNGLSGILGVLAVPVGIACLGTTGYGLFSIYSVLISFSALIDMGVGKNLARLLASDSPEEVRISQLQTSFSLYLACSGLLLASLPLLYYVIPAYIFPVGPSYRLAIQQITTIVVIEYLLAVPVNLMQTNCVAHERFDQYSKFTLIANLYRYGLMLVGFLAFASPVVTAGLVAARRILDLFVARSVLGALPASVWRPRLIRSDILDMVGKSAVLSAAQIFQTTLNGLGSIFVNRYLGLSALGTFRSAFDLASKIWFFSNGLGLLIFPRFARMLSEPAARARLLRNIGSILDASWAGYNLLGILGALAASTLLGWVGLDDQRVVTIFVLLFLALCLNSHSGLGVELLQAFGQYSSVALLSAVAMGSLIIAFYTAFAILGGSAKFSAIGWAWVISQAVYAILVDLVACSAALATRRILFRGFSYRLVVLAASITVLALYDHSSSAAYQSAAAAFTFAAVMLSLANSHWRFTNSTEQSWSLQIHGMPAFRFLASRALVASGLSRFIIIKTSSYQLRFYPSAVSATMYCNPNYFDRDQSLLKRVLRPGDTFVDVGANIGTLSLAAAQLVGPRGKVISIEAHPRTFRYLLGNIELNKAKNISAHHAIVSHSSGQGFMSDCRSDDQNAVSSSGTPIAMRPLDTLVPDTPVRLLKIDVEGFELFVLQGAKDVLKRTEMVYFESWEAHFAKHTYSTKHVISLLTECGFRLDVPPDYVSEACENLLAYRDSES